VDSWVGSGPNRFCGSFCGSFDAECLLMWRTSQGDRFLTGDEAALFRAAVGDLIEEMEMDGDEHQTGVAVFDALSYGQRVALLEDVAAAVLRENVLAPMHTAANEAAIFAIYHQIKSMIAIELDEETLTDVRRLVRLASFERGLQALAETDDRNEAWFSAVDELSDQVLWDHDFFDGELFLDAPRESDSVLQVADLAGDYFAAVPRDLLDNQLPGALTRLRELTRDAAV